jgi:hypothetical protein
MKSLPIANCRLPIWGKKLESVQGEIGNRQ